MEPHFLHNCSTYFCKIISVCPSYRSIVIAGLVVTAFVWGDRVKRFIGYFIVGAVVIFSSAAANAETIGFSGTPEQLSQVQYSRTARILQELTNAKALAEDEHLSAWLDDLGTIYASMTGRPIWTDNNGFTPRAREIIDEFKRAGDWGLNASDFKVLDSAAGELSPRNLAKMEVGLSLAIIKYAWYARGGRIEPSELSLWLDRKIRPLDGIKVIKSVATAFDSPSALVEFHPQHPQFKRLRQAYLALLKPQTTTKSKSREDIKVPARGPKLRPGAKHPDIAIIRRRLGVPAIRADAEVYDEDLAATVNQFMRTQGWRRKRTIDNRVREALNNPKQKRARKLSLASKKALLLVNMEKWRWMPDDLGDLYVWNNLPAFRTQVVKNGRVIYSERIIIGKTNTQTPIFSDEITHVVFKPEWGIPSSIKIRSLLPRLVSGDYGVLARRGMEIKYDNGVVKSPSQINWSKTDIRYVPIVMGPGSSNPLGRVKFIFPNEHAVYMHDTPNKYLFQNKRRTFSHGCIRVRHPVRLAEVLLGEQADWDAQEVADQLKRRAPGNNKVPLPEPIPVHNVYFTVGIDPATGKLVRFDDIYGHDKRILAALNGTPAAEIAKSDPARAYKRRNEELAKSPPVYRRRIDPYATALGGNFGYVPSDGYTWGKPKKWKPWKPLKPKKVEKKKRWKRRSAIPGPYQINAYQGFHRAY